MPRLARWLLGLGIAATRAREAMEKARSGQTAAGDMQAVHSRHRPFGVR